MNKRSLLSAAVALLAAFAFAPHSGAATIGPSLQTQMGTMQPTDTTLVIISFNTATGLQQSHLDLLSTLGIAAPAGSQLPVLGMVATRLTTAQINALAAESSVVSLWANDRLHYSNQQARILAGVDKLRADAALTAQNGGQVVDGQGTGGNDSTQPNKPQFSVVVIDSGIDTTNRDLPFDAASSAAGTIPATKVIQNVQVNTSTGEDGALTFEENVINNDSVGHGTHCSGTVGGTGRFSRENAATTGPNQATSSPVIGTFSDFSGVAGRVTGPGNGLGNVGNDSGVRIIGCGSGAGLFVLTALGGFEYAMANQMRYNVRITSNSYGSNGPYTPDSPLNRAIKTAYDRNITNVFAAGNDGPTINTINNSSKSPYVICVAAGTKEGGLAGFSSRGLPLAERGGPNPLPLDAAGNPYNPDAFNLPAITATGTGREFESSGPGPIDDPNPNTNARGFTSDMISTASNFGTAAGGTGGRGGNDQEFPAPYQANYTQISGTSMACPFISGTVALLLDADATLTPDKNHPSANGRDGVKEILQKTATNLPGYADWQMGAGYVNVHAAVDEAFNTAKPYESFTFRDPEDFNTPIATFHLAPPPRPEGYPPETVQRVGSANDEGFDLPYTSTGVPSSTREEALAKARNYPNDNAYAFNVVVDPATGKVPTEIDVRVAFGNSDLANEAGGNSLGLRLYAPDGTQHNAPPALPQLNYPTRQVFVRNPPLGLWVAELRPVRGLAAIPITPPVGGALPDETTGQIFRTNKTITEPEDIAEVSQADAIRAALANRYLDTVNAGGTLFAPTARVTRVDYLKALVLNTPLRQSLRSASPRFVDVDVRTSRWAEAASENGSTLRDFDFTPGPTLPVSGSANLSPNNLISRAQIAVGLVRALGLDREAQALRDIPEVTAEYPAGSGTRHRVQDFAPYDPAEPGANTQNGYFQLAINRGLMTIRAVEQPGQPLKLYADPTKPMIRANLAVVINNFRRAFGLENNLRADELPTGEPPEEN